MVECVAIAGQGDRQVERRLEAERHADEGAAKSEVDQGDPCGPAAWPMLRARLMAVTVLPQPLVGEVMEKN